MTYQELVHYVNKFTKKHGEKYRKYFVFDKGKFLDVMVGPKGDMPFQHLYQIINPTYAYLPSSNLSTVKKYVCISGSNQGNEFHCLIRDDKKLDYGSNHIPLKIAKKYECCTESTPFYIKHLCLLFAKTPINDRKLPNTVYVFDHNNVIYVNPLKHMWDHIKGWF